MIRFRAIFDDNRTLVTSVLRTTVDRRVQSSWSPKPEDVTVVTEEVEPIGRTGYGLHAAIVWSDGRTTPAWELEHVFVPDLAHAASKLINTVLGADAGTFADVGGLLVAARVTAVVAADIEIDPRPTRGGHQSPKIELLDVELNDGTHRVWYAASVGYSEGYLYEVVTTIEQARAVLADYGAQLLPVS